MQLHIYLKDKQRQATSFCQISGSFLADATIGASDYYCFAVQFLGALVLRSVQVTARQGQSTDDHATSAHSIIDLQQPLTHADFANLFGDQLIFQIE